MNTKYKVTALGIFVFAVVFVALDSGAVPAFARKYETSCITCHEAFPKLNAVGEAFRLDGYKFVDDELYVKEEPVEMGDEAYKRLWPKNAVWPADIPGLLPLSIKVTSQYEMDIGGTKDARSQFVFPNELKLLGAGRFGENISFFAEIVYSQGESGGHGHSDAEGGVSTSVEAWLQFEDLFRFENKFNLRVGTVGMQEFGLFNARDHDRLSINPYLYLSWSMPSPDDHLVPEILGGSGEVEGNDFMIHAQPGIELNGFGKRWRYAVGVVNGNGSVTDNNSEKDFYLQLAYKFGGRGFDGSTSEKGSAMGGGQPWRDDSLMLSLFGYRGTGQVNIIGNKQDDDFWRLGPGIQWKRRDLTLSAGYIFGHNDNPYGAISDDSVDSASWFLEARYVVYPWLFPYLRYEGLKLNLASGIPSLFVQQNQDRERIILGAKALVRANVTFALEGRFYTRDERQTGALSSGETGDDDQIVLALSYAF